jgi:hypothetical protein
MSMLIAKKLKLMLKQPQSDAPTLEKNAICLVSPSGEVTVIRRDQSLPTKKQEAITPL